jgi:hypothetical protein
MSVKAYMRRVAIASAVVSTGRPGCIRESWAVAHISRDDYFGDQRL